MSNSHLMSYLTTCLHKVASLMYIHDALYQLNIPRTVKRLELRPFSMKTLRIPLRIFGMDYLSSTSNLHLLPPYFPTKYASHKFLWHIQPPRPPHHLIHPQSPTTPNPRHRPPSSQQLIASFSAPNRPQSHPQTARHKP